MSTRATPVPTSSTRKNQNCLGNRGLKREYTSRRPARAIRALAQSPTMTDSRSVDPGIRAKNLHEVGERGRGHKERVIEVADGLGKKKNSTRWNPTNGMSNPRINSAIPCWRF